MHPAGNLPSPYDPSLTIEQWVQAREAHIDSKRMPSQIEFTKRLDDESLAEAMEQVQKVIDDFYLRAMRHQAGLPADSSKDDRNVLRQITTCFEQIRNYEVLLSVMKMVHLQRAIQKSCSMAEVIAVDESALSNKGLQQVQGDEKVFNG